MTSIPITAVVSTFNESKGIADCIRRLREFAEVIVVDSMSTDDTPAIAAREGATVIEFAWNGAYPKKKQWILENVATRHRWVFFVDGDESPTSPLYEELRDLTRSNALERYAACDVTLDYHFQGKLLRHGHRVTKRALIHRDRARFVAVDDIQAPGMGELEGHYQPVADGPVYPLKGRLRHLDPDPFSSWVSRHNRYSDWEAYLTTRPSVKAHVRGLRSPGGETFDRAPFKPVLFFMYSYFFKRGFLDGRAGFDYAFALSFYYWLVDLKSRELKNRRGDSR